MNVEYKVNKILDNVVIDTKNSRVLSKLNEYDKSIKKIEPKDVFIQTKNHTNKKIKKKNNKNDNIKKNKSFP